MSKTLLRISISLLILLATHARAEAGFPDFSNHWRATPLHEVKGADGPVQGRIYERFIELADGQSFSIGSVSYFKFPKPAAADPASFSPDKVAEQMRQAMGFRAWHSRQQKNAHVYEAVWDKMGRIVRLYYLDEPQSFTVSVATFRIAYGDSVSVESEILQRGLTHSLETPIPWLENLMAILESSVGLSTAWAACPPCIPTDPISMLTCASCNQTGLSGQLGQLDNSVNNAANSVNGASATGTAISNQTNANARQISDQTNATARHIADQSNATARDLGNTFNTEFHRTNDLLEHSLTGTGPFVIGALTAAGATLGSLAISTAVELGVAAVKGIIEAISHEAEDKERLANFEKAREQLEKLKPSMLKLEQEMDSDLHIAHLAQGAGSRESLIRTVSEALRSSRILSQAVGALHLNAISGGGDEDACVQQLNAEGARLDLLIDDSDKFLKALRAQDQPSICDQMNNDIDTLIKAENDLQSARLNIFKGESAWITAWDARFRQDINNSMEGDKRIPENHERDLAGAKSTQELALKKLSESYQNEYQVAFGECLDEESPIWSNIMIIGPLVTGGSRARCQQILVTGNVPDAWTSNVKKKSLVARVEHFRETYARFSDDKRTITSAYRERIRQANLTLEAETKKAGRGRANGIGNQMAFQKYRDWIKGLRSNQEGSSDRLAALGQKEVEIGKICSMGWDADIPSVRNARLPAAPPVLTPASISDSSQASLPNLPDLPATLEDPMPNTPKAEVPKKKPGKSTDLHL